MKEEFISIQKSNTWELVDLSPGRKLVQCKWVYKIKFDIDDDYDDIHSDHDSPIQPNWADKTIQAASDLVEDLLDSRKTRSQFESGLCMKDPEFAEKFYLMVDSDPQTYEEVSGDPRWQAAMDEVLVFHHLS